MGIRFEKDTILNWINEMGKFLRLLTDKWEGLQEVSDAPINVEEGYRKFFKEDRDYFLRSDNEQLETFVSSLQPEQIRPLAQLMMYDGFLSDNRDLLQKAKFLLELNMRQSGSFAFEDYGFLTKIAAKL